MEYYVIPTIGKFKITITLTYDFYDKNKINHYVLNVGGNYDKCVNITIHPENSPKNKELILSWTEVIGKECTLDGQIIKGDSTVQMALLAFTIAKEIAPYAEYITLKDMSYFQCSTPDGKKKISLPPYHIAFYGKTWYEDKFKATMLNTSDYEKYKLCIKSIDNKDLKPSYFNFGNNQIRDILVPLYTETTTWKSFFKLIEEKYPKDKCTLMYPWIDSAISYIFKQNNCDDLYVGKDWKINLKDVPSIHYYQLKDAVGGAVTSNKEYYQQYDNYRNIDYNSVEKWDINTFLQKKKDKRKTQRRKQN